ncbi:MULTISPECIES: DUF4252 domain-containing protein [Chitinophagaceae]
MKRLLLILFVPIFLQSCVVSSKPNMDFAENVKRPKGIQIVSVNAPMFIAKPFIIKALKEDGETEEVVHLIQKIKKVHVMCITVDSTRDNTAYNQAMAKSMNNFLQKGNYEEYATIRNNGQKVAIHAKQNGDIIQELMIQTISSKDGDVYVHVKAKLSPDDLSQLINMAKDKNN